MEANEINTIIDNSEYALVTENISKTYKSHLVLDKVSMNVRKGDIYGFVGENGAGKTTIIRVVTGLIFANSGTFKLFGVSEKDPRIYEIKKKMNAIVESPSIYLNMTAVDNLKMQQRMLGLQIDENKINEILKYVGLGDVDRRKKSENFSLGMRQRLGIAMCLINEPKFLILDEPLNGLDPEGIVNMRNLILKLNQEKGITFLISSHILTELSLVATRYGIISHGKLVKEVTKEELDVVEKKETFIKTTDNEKAYELLKQQIAPELLDYKDDTIIISGEIDINELVKKFLEVQVAILDIKTKQASIEDFYLSVIGGKNND